MMDFYQGEEL